MSEEDITVIRDAIAAFNRGGVEAALEYVDPDVEWVGPPDWLEERVYRGHDGVRKVASLWTDNFDDFRLDLERTIDAGDHVIALMHQRATMKRVGGEIEGPVAWVFHTRAGKAIHVDVYFSWEAALDASGLETQGSEASPREEMA
jgi:ketosteroid isomerase-like protein